MATHERTRGARRSPAHGRNPEDAAQLVPLAGASIGLDLTGLASTIVVVRRVADAVVVEDSSTAPAPEAVVTSSTFDFLAWSTTCTPWREVTQATGDVSIAASFLDELNLI
ncbi:hypothetical protein [Streptomyces sp. NPDC002088]|uniref:hypothetical protein n=1 Tax=Streptomyces sp. NPDC002088 TaxID=3154665 RepID=UPI003322D370